MFTTYNRNLFRQRDSAIRIIPTRIVLPESTPEGGELRNNNIMQTSGSDTTHGPPGLAADLPTKSADDGDPNKVVWAEGDAENPHNW